MTAKIKSKKELCKILAEKYKIRYTVSQGMTPEQIQVLYNALEEEGHLSGAIQVIIAERNSKATNNSRLGLDKHNLENKLVDTREKLSYVERQLEKYKELTRDLLKDLLNLENSEIYKGLQIVLKALS